MTGDDLYKEICRVPEDDTLRLAYADWLDEQPTSRPCAQCEGTGYGVKTGAYSWRVCDCGGTGSVADTGNRDRAELIRVQCEREPLTRGRSLLTDGLGWDTAKRVKALVGRERELIEVHPEWLRLPCEACAGGGIIDQGCHCPTCSGTGDLFVAPPPSGLEALPPPVPRTVTFDRGLVGAVHCAPADVLERECSGCGGRAVVGEYVVCRCGHADSRVDLRPTAWAAAVVRQSPVVRFVLSGMTPYWNGRGFCWYRRNRDWPSESVPPAAELWGEWLDALPGGAKSSRLTWYRTERQAQDALALGTAAVVRRHVHGEVTA